MNMKQSIFALLVPLSLGALASCSSRDFSVYYNPEPLSADEYVALSKGQRPQIQEVFDIKSKVDSYLNQGYIVLGTMSLSGESASNSELISFASSQGASLVLYTSEQTGTITKRYAVPVTNTSYARTSGTVSSSYGYGSPSYHYQANTTITSTDWQSRSYQVGAYKQFYVFLSPKTK